MIEWSEGTKKKETTTYTSSCGRFRIRFWDDFEDYQLCDLSRPKGIDRGATFGRQFVGFYTTLEKAKEAAEEELRNTSSGGDVNVPDLEIT